MRLLPKSANANARHLLSAKALRSIADGYVSVLLPAYLLEIGLSPFRAGILSTATLLEYPSLRSGGSAYHHWQRFTHLPSNLCLIAIPFASNLHIAVTLLLIRSLLSQMDVPTRSSYVMAVVTPPERPAAAAITTVPRSLAAAVSPTIGGYLLTVSSFGWPLLIGGVVKAAYDLALLLMFQHVRPPEERQGVSTSP